MFETLRVIRFSFRNGGFFEFRWMDNMVSYFRQSEHRSTDGTERNTRLAKHFHRHKCCRSKYSETGSKVFMYNGRIKEGNKKGWKQLQQRFSTTTSSCYTVFASFPSRSQCFVAPQSSSSAHFSCKHFCKHFWHIHTVIILAEECR
jgi:hypothetical protein